MDDPWQAWADEMAELNKLAEEASARVFREFGVRLMDHPALPGETDQEYCDRLVKILECAASAFDVEPEGV